MLAESVFKILIAFSNQKWLMRPVFWSYPMLGEKEKLFD
jgi:hypothetical protein